MLVKGTHTVKQRIEVEIDDCELKHILRSCSNVLLLSILQERAENEFLNALAGRPGDFCVRKRTTSRGCGRSMPTGITTKMRV